MESSDSGVGEVDLNAEVNVVDYTPLVNNSIDGAESQSRAASTGTLRRVGH